jgi:NAD(P)-dependent dehydrogenase (short-subunit alcohol dehydrogenase family)
MPLQIATAPIEAIYSDPAARQDRRAPAHEDIPMRTALVTGSGRGIGWAITERLLRDGYGVVAAEVSRRGLEVLQERATARSDERLLPARVDVTSRAEIEAAVQAAVDRWGRLDVLVNNAGRNRAADSLTTTDEDWDWILDTNLKAVFFCSQIAAAQMKAQGGGAIVNISSTSAGGLDGNPAYSASKAGVIGLTRAMAVELGPSQIRVNAVAPGTTLSEWVRKNSTPDSLTAAANRNPLRRNGEPEDVANSVAFLASEDAQHVTGQLISVSGGGWMP